MGWGTLVGEVIGYVRFLVFFAWGLVVVVVFRVALAPCLTID